MEENESADGAAGSQKEEKKTSISDLEMNMQNRHGFLDWFAGFVAADGCFIIRHGRTGFTCALTIRLRDDDLSVLLEIQEALQMGTIRRDMRKQPQQPNAIWQAGKIDDVLRLIDIFDTHPLRAKKQKDYEIWREAALEINRGRQRKGKPAIYDRQYLEHLAQKLKIIRVYDPPEIDEFEPEGEQLTLEFYRKEHK